ncbi:MAG: hypothetical protein CR972_04975 [Candidatus Moraniibacteriota bacterium]|nr:MAG: hypothetical protein CR972_04975 [Candidatus Moranbacteria bacterium]
MTYGFFVIVCIIVLCIFLTEKGGEKVHDIRYVGTDEAGFLSVNGDNGMIVGGLFQGKNVFFPFMKRADGKERGGCPICFPAFGPPAPVYSGEEQHGWLRHAHLHTYTEDRSVISFGVHAIGGLYYGNMNVSVMHTAKNHALISRLSFAHNPVCIDDIQPLVRPGFHPYFPNDGATKLIVKGQEYTKFCQEARCIFVDSSDEIVIDTGRLRMTMVLEGFTDRTCLYLWSDNPRKYFCVEPVFCAKEEFLLGRSMLIEHGKTYSMAMKLFL